MPTYKKLSYWEALKMGIKGEGLIVVLPENVNPGYLACGDQKYHPCACPLDIKGMSYKDARSRFNLIRIVQLDHFCNEPNVSRKRVQAWLVQ